MEIDEWRQYLDKEIKSRAEKKKKELKLKRQREIKEEQRM